MRICSTCTLLQLRPIKEVLLELHPKDYFMELGIVAALILYIVNIFVGSQANKKIADKWCMAFGINNGILAQQFSFVGIGELPHDLSRS